MNNPASYAIEVSVQTRYLEDESAPERDYYVFAYTVRLQNTGTIAARLVSRHWIITDGNGEVEEIRGEGVIGQQPLLKPGEGFEYSSGAVLKTDVGSMRGSYRMQAEDGNGFEADIPAFTLSIPRVLH
jgi:ApaG protein